MKGENKCEISGPNILWLENSKWGEINKRIKEMKKKSIKMKYLNKLKWRRKNENISYFKKVKN